MAVFTTAATSANGTAPRQHQRVSRWCCSPRTGTGN